MNATQKRDVLFLILAGFFVTNAIVAELIGGKLIKMGPFTMSIGVIPWPVVFLTTDLINEYFGRDGVRRLTLMTSGLIVYAFVILFIAIGIPSADFSPVSSQQFAAVFGQSLWIIAGSIVAFMVAQLVDVAVFWAFRSRTGKDLLWLRATGSTAVSQLIDTFIILGIAFWLPGQISTLEFLNLSASNYVYKFVIAVLLTPLIYASHSLIDRFLGEKLSDQLIQNAAQKS